MAKLLVLIQGKGVAASRYRILQYIPYLEEHGLRCEVMEFPGTVKEYLRLYRILPLFESVFVQRKRFHFPFLMLFRSRAKRVVYDLDDAVMYKNTLADTPYSKTRQRRFANMVRQCDVVIAGNSFLKEKAQEYNSSVEVIPSSIPSEKYRLKDYSVRSDVVTIGWIGDHGSIHYLERMKDVFETIGRRYPGKVKLKIICDTFFDLEHLPVEKVQWSESGEVSHLQDIDIGVMPLIDDPWSWGKCGLKILQYFGVGVPAVCTPVGVNRDVVTDGITGYWAITEQEWVEKISRLIEDTQARQTMGIRGRQVLEQGYTREVNAPRILAALQPE
ncbi:MAG: glycosyltransferase family 4 protein [Deltaproteobacteria bacterium]|nr:glycosyltransferase family 4 protein [Deltaproteobacteria bacterium]